MRADGIRVTSRRSPARCAVCHDALHAVAPCASCGTAVHDECVPASGCPTIGCARRRVVVRAGAAPPRAPVAGPLVQGVRWFLVGVLAATALVWALMAVLAFALAFALREVGPVVLVAVTMLPAMLAALGALVLAGDQSHSPSRSSNPGTSA